MTPISLVSPSPAALRTALTQRGMDPVRAEAAASGLKPVAVMVDGVGAEDREALALVARRNDVECLTGDGWALLAGGAARIAGLVRAGISTLPAALAEELGRLAGGVATPPACWPMGRGTISLERPVVVGIVNVTPDSFSDGGRYLDPEEAVRHAASLIDAGADMIDVGAESTRPGRPEPIDAGEEWRRLAPVLGALARDCPEVPVSVDTVKAATARRALDAGVWAINDVGALRLDPEMARVCAGHDAGLILMHSRGTVRDMATYDHAVYENVTVETIHELQHALAVAEAGGVERGRLVLDPGLGFAKRPEHNYELLRDLPALVSLGYPVMVGPSRKRFLGAVTGRDIHQRDLATAAACATAYLAGAALFRVHAVGPTCEALAVAHAVRSA